MVAGMFVVADMFVTGVVANMLVVANMIVSPTYDVKDDKNLDRILLIIHLIE